jgi:GT2 family glycosyltransferase
MSIDVSVIVVSYNARHLLDDCLRAVEQHAGDALAVETIVVDNDSTDGSADHVYENWPNVRVVETGRNGGMAAGNNEGMKVATGDYFLLLNSDAFLQAGALSAMVERFRNSDGGAGGRDGGASGSIAMVVPQLRNADGTLQRSIRGFPTPWRLATEFWGLRKIAPRSRMFNSFYGAGQSHDTAHDIEWAMGACMLVSREVVDRIGMMDESFFMYSEEVDWQQRMHDACLRVVFEPAARVTHLGGGSTGGATGELFATQVDNSIRCIEMHRGTASARRARRVVASALIARGFAFSLLAAVTSGDKKQRWFDRSKSCALARTRIAHAWELRNESSPIPR